MILFIPLAHTWKLLVLPINIFSNHIYPTLLTSVQGTDLGIPAPSIACLSGAWPIPPYHIQHEIFVTEWFNILVLNKRERLKELLGEPEAQPPYKPRPQLLLGNQPAQGPQI